jgi:hypothetical protein
MIITLVRFKDDGKRTLGKLFINGQYECCTLEDSYRVPKIKGQTRIPFGIYRLELRISPKFSPRYKHEMIWVKDVPNFEYILIHPGNTEDHTEGCILVGRGFFKEESLVSSRDCYDDLYPKISKAIQEGKPVWFTVVDYDKAK